ncbi:uncharacterized protein LOC126668695 [Mercurialis annua]|uniref:uncharacterized protein LOC126668695 n=1 Tax=Mercurialis annua TaxID=3986 RepID=UPI00215F17C9|nr:uncharacterized protein LOC126668695 [Mercurialis annua]
MMTDPYPMHPDQVADYHHDLFHGNEDEYDNKPASETGQPDEHFVNKGEYLQNDDIVQIAHSALQNELFADNDMENEVENNLHNEQYGAQDVPFEIDNNTDTQMEDHNLLWPVLPGESGEGLPYAPIDWPFPGDVWTWRVGRRYNNTGYFQDRFLQIPKRIGRQTFASKNAVANYIKSNFAGADVDAFFASFAWKIPVKIPSPKKVESAPPAPSQEEKVAGQEEEKANDVYSSGRKRRAVVASSAPPKEIEENGEPISSASKRRRQSTSKISPPPSKPTKQTRQKGGKSTPASKKAKQNEAALSSPPSRKTRQTGKRSSHSAHNEEVIEEPIEEPIPEDFDNYLSSLEDIISQPLTIVNISSPSPVNDSVAAQIEMAEARSKISSLLLMDFPSLISPKNITELTTLASKLRKDPNMNAEQLVKLKLIEEIPSFSEVFIESRELIDQVDEFFATLEAKKAKIASLKNEYSELKEKADQLQSQVDANSMGVDEIDRQIALLRSRRAELTSAIETNKAAKTEVSSAQKMVASAIPKVVHEIQNANAKIPNLELKRTNAVKREAEIRAKFAPLEGFAL